jgi:hypothetical protein
MSTTEKLLTAVALFGLMAGAVAARLVWMVLTRPVAVAEAFGGIW